MISSESPFLKRFHQRQGTFNLGYTQVESHIDIAGIPKGASHFMGVVEDSEALIVRKGNSRTRGAQPHGAEANPRHKRPILAQGPQCG
jgi:hypothetical protein